MKSHHRHLLALMIAFSVAVVGCHPSGGNTRNIIDIFSINENLPLLSDVYNFGANSDTAASEDDFIPVDIIEVTFVSRVHDDALSTVDPGGPFGSVTFHTYEVQYGTGTGGADLDGNGVIDLANFVAPMNAIVPTGGAGRGYVLLVSGGAKVVEPLSCLGPVGGGGCGAITDVEYGVNALVTFHGTEETSGEEITVSRGILIRISQFGDE